MKRVYVTYEPECFKRFCHFSPFSDIESIPSPYEYYGPIREKEFYEGDNGIIKLKEKIISIVDPKPRIIHRYALEALKKPGTYFVQTKSNLLGPFFITPTPDDLPKGELVMIYECCSAFSETSTCCFRPIGLLQN
ncbi:MSP domain-containing protein [Caenorhabditis elegans]|uniref:MSP domain-containing protein n=1 Tax=Caenorhabditis elegans TaxID=6239 RepID=Q8MQA0_CAEEL|nr:MSP domain-containing protein [Caenorhabditis elegans]CAD36482.2 MSP domain-containing protein [Caenorhabditis elegans]|eukprot:NP_741907.2 Uncharacterized protein CELE_C49F5.8 [Caenorhabditis elegans]